MVVAMMVMITMATMMMTMTMVTAPIALGRGLLKDHLYSKITLLTEAGGTAPAVSSLISRLLFYGSLGPDTWSYLNEPFLNFPKSRA